MSISPDQQAQSGWVPVIGGVSLACLALGWAITIVFSVSEPSLLSAVVGIPTFLFTPIVAGGLMWALRKTRRTFSMDRIVFYGAAAMLVLLAVYVITAVVHEAIT